MGARRYDCSCMGARRPDPGASACALSVAAMLVWPCRDSRSASERSDLRLAPWRSGSATRTPMRQRAAVIG
jgi:hypothetical protein